MKTASMVETERGPSGGATTGPGAWPDRRSSPHGVNVCSRAPGLSVPLSRQEATMIQFRVFVSCLALGIALGISPSARSAPQAAQTLSSDALFQTAKVWTVHLTLSREAWSKLTPVPPPPPPPPAGGVPPPSGLPQAIPSALPPEVLKRLLAGFLGPEGGRNGISAQRGVQFEYVHASIDLDGRRFDDVAVRAKGNGTFTPVSRFAKPSIKIDFDKYVKGQKLAGVSTINLHNNITDASWMNEVLAFRLYRDAGVPAPRTAYAKVYVTVTGGEARKYLGLYSVVENVDTDFAASRFKVSGGAILKPVTIVPFKFLSRDWADYNQMYDPKTTLTAADKGRVIDFCDLVSNATDQVFAARAAEFVDLDAFAKYMAVVAWMANPDSLLQQGQNYYVHLHPTTRKFVFVPWDQDHSFGQFVPFTPAEAQQQLDLLHPWTNRFAGAPFAAQLENTILARTFALPAFKRAYLAELATLSRSLTTPERLGKQVEELGAILAPIVADEPKDGRVMAFAESLGEAPFKRPINQNITVTPIKTFLRLRQASVLAQLKALGVQ
jgi:CotH protein